jgi:transposase
MTVKATCLVGLDVHARQTHAAVLDVASGELRACRMRLVPEEVVSFLASLPAPVLAVYEAGPTGFGLARAARQRGIDVRVVAPGSIPKGPGDRVKTDRRDAIRLVRLLAAGELRFAFIPSVEDEAFRDLIRCIEDARGDLMRARHRCRSSCSDAGSATRTARRGRAGTCGGWRRSASRIAARKPRSPTTSRRWSCWPAAGRRCLRYSRRRSPTGRTRTRPRACAASAGSTVSRQPGCAPRSAPSPGSQGRRSCPGSSGSRPASAPRTPNAARVRSPRPAPGHARRLLVEAAHHYRRPPRMAKRSPAASKDRTRA